MRIRFNEHYFFYDTKKQSMSIELISASWNRYISILILKNVNSKSSFGVSEFLYYNKSRDGNGILVRWMASCQKMLNPHFSEATNKVLVNERQFYHAVSTPEGVVIMETERKPTGNTEEELTAYEKLRQRVSKSFGELNEKINRESINQAVEKAIGDLKEMGEHSKESIAKAGETLKKDVASTADQLKPKVDKVTEPAREQFDSWLNKGGALWRDIANEAEYVMELSRDKGAAFVVNVTRGLREWSEKLETSLTYKSGEMTHGGEFVCTSCEGKIHLKKPGRIPPCPKCSNSEFRRS